MDLPQLLEPERIRCRCDIHSKKRALQTVAELLGASLRRANGAAEADGAGSDAGAPDERGPGAGNATGQASGNGATSPSGTSRDAAPGRAERGGRRERAARKSERGTKKRGDDRADEPAEISDMVILDALINRERLGSTGLGHGVALPHSRLDVIDAPLAAMITLNEGVDFEAGDGEPVDLVLGLLVPQDCNDEHLKILANLARRFNDAELREALRGHDSEEELFEHLQRLAAS